MINEDIFSLFSDKNNSSDKENQEEYLKIFLSKSVLIREDGQEEIFLEGKTSSESKQRVSSIKNAFQDGFLQKMIDACKSSGIDISDITEEQITILNQLVSSITSEVGRGLVALTILQLSIKCVCPEQSIRLHKTFWCEGIPMRSLDNTYNTPVLRKNDLLRLNRDGAFMTRSLAENYPYTKFYKASIRGAKDAWVTIVEMIERGQLNSNSALRYILAFLLRETDSFSQLSKQTLKICSIYMNQFRAEQKILHISEFISLSTYSARLLEIAMHSLMQVLEDDHALLGPLKRLSQMRSANKKHGNVADIEITDGLSELQIIEAWDAKYGKPYLRDELEELVDKLNDHPETKIAGFVTESLPDLRSDVIERKEEIEEIYGVSIKIQSFSDWIKEQLSRANSPHDQIVDSWILAFVETLCQKRRDRAPIDEPVNTWVAGFKEFVERKLKPRHP